MRVTDDTHVLVPFFHGTSSLFLSSILDGGLGAKNPHASLATHELLAEVIAAGAEHFGQDPDIGPELPVIQRMVEQRVTGSANFRHGSAYLTPSRDTAARYALTNPFGSELLSHALRLFSALQRVDARTADTIRTRFAPAVAVVDHQPAPILVEVRGVGLHQLRAENSGEAASIIAQMQTIASSLNGALLEAMWQQCNFELISPVPPSQLTVYRIKRLDDDPIVPAYELERA